MPVILLHDEIISVAHSQTPITHYSLTNSLDIGGVGVGVGVDVEESENNHIV